MTLSPYPKNSVHSQEIKQFLEQEGIKDYYLLDDDPYSPITALLPSITDFDPDALNVLESLKEKAIVFFNGAVNVTVSFSYNSETEKEDPKGLDFFAS